MVWEKNGFWPPDHESNYSLSIYAAFTQYQIPISTYTVLLRTARIYAKRKKITILAHPGFLYELILDCYEMLGSPKRKKIILLCISPPRISFGSENENQIIWEELQLSSYLGAAVVSRTVDMSRPTAGNLAMYSNTTNLRTTRINSSPKQYRWRSV